MCSTNDLYSDTGAPVRTQHLVKAQHLKRAFVNLFYCLSTCVNYYLDRLQLLFLKGGFIMKEKLNIQLRGVFLLL